MAFPDFYFVLRSHGRYYVRVRMYVYYGDILVTF